jgi:tetratricopeptide (TPR) repeat protein
MTNAEYHRQISHAGVLIQQNRYLQAQEKLTRLVSAGYSDPDLYRMLIMCRMGLSQYDDARMLAEKFLQQHPNDAFAFYTLAGIDLNNRDLKTAHTNIDEAIRLQPHMPEFFALKSAICFQLKDYGGALQYADIGLNTDAQHIGCLNARSSALEALGRKEEAFATISKSLNEDPNNPDTHTNIGWGHLHRGDTQKALDHFKAALNEDPLHENAKAGMLQAMKTRFPLYRYFLMVMLWLSRLTSKNQWIFIIGSYIAYRVLLNFAKTESLLRPVIIGLIVLLVLFFLASWLFSPVMNLYMLTNPYGRMTMSVEEKQSARYVGFAFAGAVVAGILFILFRNEGLITLAVSILLMMIPLGSMNNAYLDHNKSKLRKFTVLLLILLSVNAVLSIVLNTVVNSFSIVALGSIIVYQWYANYILIRE